MICIYFGYRSDSPRAFWLSDLISISVRVIFSVPAKLAKSGDRGTWGSSKREGLFAKLESSEFSSSASFVVRPIFPPWGPLCQGMIEVAIFDGHF